jgi:hypothetical protein
VNPFYQEEAAGDPFWTASIYFTITERPRIVQPNSHFLPVNYSPGQLFTLTKGFGGFYH